MMFNAKIMITDLTYNLIIPVSIASTLNNTVIFLMIGTQNENLKI